MQVIYGSAQNKAHSFFLKCNIKYFLWKYSKWQIFFNKNVFSSLSSKMLNQQLSIFVLSVLKLKGWFLHQQCVKTKTKGLQKLINTHTHTFTRSQCNIESKLQKHTASFCIWLAVYHPHPPSVSLCMSVYQTFCPSIWCLFVCLMLSSVCLSMSVCL